MSDDLRPRATPTPAGPRGPASRGRRASAAGARRRCPTTRGWRSRSASLVERGAMDEARERFAGLVAHPPAPRRRASPISICATPPKPTRPSRTRSSRSSATSRRIARRGRSRSGSRAFSSTAAWIGARRARAATLVRRRRRCRARDEARVVGRPARATDPEAAAAGARAPRAARRGDRPARRPSAHRLHAVPLRRLHAAGGQRHDRPERIDRARPLFRAARKLRGLLGGKP